MKVDFHPEAQEEFVEASARYDIEVPGLGERFITELVRAKKLLGERPEIAAKIDPVFRRFVMGTFPYSLIYSIEPDVVWVVAVAHQSRQPGYWRDRAAR